MIVDGVDCKDIFYSVVSHSVSIKSLSFDDLSIVPYNNEIAYLDFSDDFKSSFDYYIPSLKNLIFGDFGDYFLDYITDIDSINWLLRDFGKGINIDLVWASNGNLFDSRFSNFTDYALRGLDYYEAYSFSASSELTKSLFNGVSFSGYISNPYFSFSKSHRPNLDFSPLYSYDYDCYSFDNIHNFNNKDIGFVSNDLKLFKIDRGVKVSSFYDISFEFPRITDYISIDFELDIYYVCDKSVSLSSCCESVLDLTNIRNLLGG